MQRLRMGRMSSSGTSPTLVSMSRWSHMAMVQSVFRVGTGHKPRLLPNECIF